MSYPVVAEVVRSGFVEGHHHGSVVALAADGSIDWSVGKADVPILPRSCNKPIQALGMVRAGRACVPAGVDGCLTAWARRGIEGLDWRHHRG